MDIINILDNTKAINKGLWHSALSTSKILDELGIHSVFWVLSKKARVKYDGIEILYLSFFEMIFRLKQFPEKQLIVISHGAWRLPTIIGFISKYLGCKWVYVPQGMLEPWSLSQKAAKKMIYLYIFEKPMVLHAAYIRAVSTPEKNNLTNYFTKNRIIMIPNGVPKQAEYQKPKNGIFQYCFMARLHKKKGIKYLVEGWIKSDLHNIQNYKLLIAGPDEGELNSIQKLISSNNTFNIKYLGVVDGEEKIKLLQSSVFYVLPSFSEGFPTSVLEAMSFGCIPVITDGCNFPEAIEAEVAIKIDPNIESMQSFFIKSKDLSIEELTQMGQKAQKFVSENYSIEKIASKQISLFKNLLYEI